MKGQHCSFEVLNGMIKLQKVYAADKAAEEM